MYDKKIIPNLIWKEILEVFKYEKCEKPLIVHENNTEKHEIGTQKYEKSTPLHIKYAFAKVETTLNKEQ